jgi:hypothetical protein
MNCTAQSAAQGVSEDPLAMLQELMRQKQIELRHSFEDQQRERLRNQQEEAHDRDMCVRVGYRGPDVEQCIRDSAAYRRGERPTSMHAQPSDSNDLGAPVEDLSRFGTPVEQAKDLSGYGTPVGRVEDLRSDNEIAKAIVQESRQQYYSTGHPCACPDDVMRNGRRCGNVSAYVRPGGAEPLCYVSDVTKGMIDAYRVRH